MSMSQASVVMGLLFASLSTIALILNIFVIIAIMHSKMMHTHSPVYIFSFATIINDLLMIALHLFYFAPASAMQDFLFPPHMIDFGLKFLDIMNMICWYHGTMSHIFIAINRFVIFVFDRSSLFTRLRVVKLAIFQVLISVFLVFMTQFIFPCCRLTLNYTVFTYTYLQTPGVSNFSNMFDLPLNSIASLTPLFIAIMTIKARDKLKRRRHRDYTLAIQFAIMALIYTIVWTSVRIMPVILNGTHKMYLYGFTTCVNICNTSTNAVVYLTNNIEIKRSLRSLVIMSTSRTSVIELTKIDNKAQR